MLFISHGNELPCPLSDDKEDLSRRASGACREIFLIVNISKYFWQNRKMIYAFGYRIKWLFIHSEQYWRQKELQSFHLSTKEQLTYTIKTCICRWKGLTHNALEMSTSRNFTTLRHENGYSLVRSGCCGPASILHLTESQVWGCVSVECL